MIIDYKIFNPTGNITALCVTDVPPSERTSVAGKIMENSPDVEQVGFVRRQGDELFLDMTGGEFCGNASMCAAAYFAGDVTGDTELILNVSGSSEKVKVLLSPSGDEIKGTVNMPAVESVRYEIIESGAVSGAFPVVRFPGIAHIITDPFITADDAKQSIGDICASLGCECLGIMIYDGEASSLVPVVYVRDAGTVFVENSCLSGTSALAAFLQKSTGGEVFISVHEPGGCLKAKAKADGSVSITGSVSFTGDYSIEI